jgi:hypothetical protein
MSKLDGLIVRWLCVSTNGIKIQMLGVVVSKVNFDCLRLKLLICSPETENIFSVVGPLWMQVSVMFSGTQKYSTLFLALSNKSCY